MGQPRKPGKPLKKPKSVPPDENSQVLFDRIAEEVLHADRAMFDALSPHERNLVVRWLSDAIIEGGEHNEIHDVLWELDYHTKPVGIEQFIHDDYYLGRVAADLHPKWKEDLSVVFAPGSPIFEWVMTGAIGIGKALAVDTRVLTPTGWVRADAVKVGDLLVGRDGMSTRVSGVFPQGQRSLCRVTFNDGATSLVDEDHLWAVQTPSGLHRQQPWQVCATRDLLVDHHIRADALKWHIPVVDPVEFDPVDLPLPAYAVGALIGDGCLVAGGIRFSSVDPEIVERVACELDVEAKHTGYGCDYRLARTRGDRVGHPLSKLRAMGLCVRSCEKRVPPAYLFGSVQDRKRMLAGLLDTDGWVQNGGSTTAFSTSSPGLAEDVMHLVRSLGGVARRTHKKTPGLDAHILTIRLSFCPFELSRKREAWNPSEGYGSPRRMISSIEPAETGAAVCFKVEAPDGLFVIDGFVVTHNTTLADIGIAYKLYVLSCLRNASAYYGLLTDSLIVFGVYSITKRQVADAGYFKLRGFIDSSPYFRNEFPRSTKIDSKIDFQRTTGRPVQVIPGSQELHALGLDLFSFLMDEVNFMRVKDTKEAGIQTGQAYDLYNATYTRLQSRFIRPGGTLPGMMFLLSSRNAQTSFLEEHLKKVRHLESTYISDYPLWEVKPAHRFTKKWFRVEVGDRVSASRLLKEDEEPRKGAKVVSVPGEFHKPFTEDVDQALRDIAGIATFNLSPLIRDRQSVFDAVHPDMKHPFTRQIVTVSMDDDVRIDEYLKLRDLCRPVQSVWQPVLNPRLPRFMHIDIGLSGDALGLAMGHVAGIVRDKRTLVDGTESIVSNPFAVIDLMLRVTAPPGGEVELAKVRGFVTYLSRLYPLTRVTFDGFQSADSIQILTGQGIESGLLSVDRTDEAYLSLRSALFDRRIAYYQYDPFEYEVLDLERDIQKRKVDHPLRATRGGKGSKDVSDAVAGVIWQLVNDPRARSVASLLELDPIGERSGKSAATQVVHVAPSEVMASEERRVGAMGVLWDDLRKNLKG